MLYNTKKGRAPGPDNITVEEIEALGEYGIQVLTKLLNDIYNTGYIPADMLQSIFIALPKKPGSIECEDHRTISLMSHVTKLLLRIIMRRIRSKIKPEIGEEQCGFVEGKGTSNAIYIVRTIIERAIEVKTDLYMCFIDYTKAFDNVKHNEIFNMLKELNIDGKDLRIIANMYWKQTAAIRIENKIGKYQQIKKGVRQGCVLSPDLFSLYSEIIMRAIENMPGISIGGYNINNVRYADDTVIIANSEKELQAMMDVITDQSQNKGLSLNNKKTEVMVISKKSCPKCVIKINGTTLKQVSQFKYLGTLITADGKCAVEIRNRITQSKIAFWKMKSVLCNRSLSMKLRKRVLQCYIEPILTYGCESWTVNKQARKSLEATEMWFYRRMMRISWTEKRTNEDILKEANMSRALMKSIRKKQSSFFGHIMRREKMEYIVTTGKIPGRRDRGRQREKILDSLTAWHGVTSVNELIAKTRERELWRNMIAYANRHGT